MQPVAPSVVIVGTGSDAHMRSATPRALHTICGRTLVAHVLAAVAAVEPRRLSVAIGPRDDDVEKELGAAAVDVVRVASNVRYDPCAAALSALGGWADDDLDLDLDPDDDDVIVAPASLPLLTGDTLRTLHRRHRQSDAAATALVGRGGDRDTAAVWMVRRSLLAPALRRTERPAIAALGMVLDETGHDVASMTVDDDELLEVRDRADLAAAEAVMRARINERWMRQGVTMRDPAHTSIDATVAIEPDVTLATGVVLAGATTIGAGTDIGPGCHLVDTAVGAHCELEHTSAKLATVGDNARVGPYAVLDPGSEIAAATVTGPFYTADLDAR